jgi:predicted naringenin-chalcone synthase
MFICGIGTAVPKARYTKAACLAAFTDSDWHSRLDARARYVARAVLERDNGMDARRLAVDDLREVFCIDPDTLSARFAAHAPRLAAEAGADALVKAGIEPQAIDAVVVSTCTGYLCPGLSGYVIERLGLRRDLQAFDLVGQGCAAALPNLSLGSALITAGASATVLSVCVEVSSAAMYLDNDPGVMISACLFGDGAGAAVLSGQPTSHRRIRWKEYASSIDPANRQALRFEQRAGMLRNVLTRQVPALAAEHGLTLLEQVLATAQLRIDDVGTWIMHAGGRDVLQAIEKRFGLRPADLRYSAAMLREYGNLSSAFIYFVLEAALADPAPGGLWWLSSFGAGFSCHGALLEVE